MRDENEKDTAIREALVLLHGIDCGMLKERKLAGAATFVECAIRKLTPPTIDVEQGPSGPTTPFRVTCPICLWSDRRTFIGNLPSAIGPCPDCGGTEWLVHLATRHHGRAR